MVLRIYNRITYYGEVDKKNPIVIIMQLLTSYMKIEIVKPAAAPLNIMLFIIIVIKI